MEELILIKEIIIYIVIAQIKKQVVETTCESHEKTSIATFLKTGEVAW